MNAIIMKFWILSVIFSILNGVNALQSPRRDDPGLDNAMPSSSSSIFDPVKAYAAAVVLETEIEITISAKKLEGPLSGSGMCLKPDPMCVIYTYSPKSGSRGWTEYERTEFLADNRNPEFAQKVLMPYSWVHENMILNFEIYSHDFWRTEAERVSLDHRILGYNSCRLEKLVRRGRMELDLAVTAIDSRKVHKVKGQVIVYAEQLIANYDQVIVRFAGVNVKQKGLFGQRKPYIEIHKLSPISNEYVLAHRTNVVERSANPQWEAFNIPLKNLCNGSYDRSLKFSYWEWVRRAGNLTSRTFVGQFITTLGEIVERNARNEKTFDLRNPRRLVVMKDSGQLKVDLHVLEVPSFADFIRAGLRIHCIIAVDFSKTNGDPKLKESLHYRKVNDTSSSLNQYEKALGSVVGVLGDFGWNKKVTFMSYGARYPDTANNFEIAGDKLVDIVDCSGTEDVLKAYRKHLMEDEFDSNANLLPVLQTVISIAKARNSPRDYFILFVLTPDGRISNTEEAERIMSEASALPVSIIMMAIGHGRPPFANLKELRQKQEEGGNRNILHFLSFNDCRPFYDADDVDDDPDDPFPNSDALSCLATRLLAELPNQVITYMRSNGYTPDHMPSEHLRSPRPSSSASHPNVPEDTRSVNLPPEPLIPNIDEVSSAEAASPAPQSSIPLPAGELNPAPEPHSPARNVSSHFNSHFDIPSGASSPLSPPKADISPTQPRSSDIHQIDEDSNEDKAADVEIFNDLPSPHAGIISSPSADIITPELVAHPSSDFTTVNDFSNMESPPDLPSQSGIQLTDVRPLRLADARLTSSSDDSSLYGTPRSSFSPYSQHGHSP